MAWPKHGPRVQSCAAPPLGRSLAESQQSRSRVDNTIRQLPRLLSLVQALGDASKAKEHYDILLPLFPKTDTELREGAKKAGCKLP